MHVYVVWEPVLPTDLSVPSTTTLGRVPDLRAAQYWDKQRVLSHVLGERSVSSIIWDYVAVYAPGTTWDATLPQPVGTGRPVVKAIDKTRDAIMHLLSQDASSKTQASAGN